MWLDRFAAQSSPTPSTSQPSSRPYSPLPRRTSSAAGPYVTSHRPGNTPRGSSISLVSNDSSASLLASSRKPNGSGLKQSQTAYDGPDPLETLRRILGQQEHTNAPRDQSLPIGVEDLDLDIDFGGLGLRDFATSEAEPRDAARPANQRHSVEECTCRQRRFESGTDSRGRRERQDEVRGFAPLYSGLRRCFRFGRSEPRELPQ